METISEIRLKDLGNALYAQFMSDVNDLITELTPKALRISKCYSNYKAWLDKLNASFVRQTKDNLTASLEVKDKERDDRYRCFLAHVKADLLNGDPAKRESAQRVLNRIEALPNVLKSSRRKQSAEMTDMGQALSEEPLATDVENIGQTENLNQMIAANNNYIELSKQRTKGRENIQLNAVKEARAGLDGAYREVVSMVNAQITYNALLDESDLEDDSESGFPEVQALLRTTDVLAEFTRRLNTMIREYKTEVEQSGPDKDEENPGTEPTDPDTTPETPDGGGEETPEEPDDRPVVQ